MSVILHTPETELVALKHFITAIEHRKHVAALAGRHQEYTSLNKVCKEIKPLIQSLENAIHCSRQINLFQ